MKLRKRMLCLLLLACVLASCGKSLTEQTELQTTETVTQAQTTAVDNSARDAFFAAPREKTPRVVTGTVDGVEYKVTFDNTEYVLGDEFTFLVEATNVSGEAISVSRPHGEEESLVMTVRFYQNDKHVAGGFWFPYERMTMTLTTDWLPSETWVKEGFFSTSVLDMNAEGDHVVECRVQAKSDLEPFCFDIPVNMDVPEDLILLPYLESGQIDSALYIRARCMTEEETIVVCSKYPDSVDTCFPDTPAEEIPQWVGKGSLYLNGYSRIRLTRKQLIAILEHGHYGEKVYQAWDVRNLVWNYPSYEM